MLTEKGTAPRKAQIQGELLKSLIDFVKARKQGMKGGGWLSRAERGLYVSRLNELARKWGIPRSYIFENNHTGGYRLRIEPERITLPARAAG